MKRRDQSAHSRIYVIAEDKTGYFVLDEIVRKKEIAVKVILRGEPKGVSSLAKDLKGIIDTLLRTITDQDCIIVLHDTDTLVETYRDHYQKIERICNSYHGRVTRLEAIQEIEAWLLADEGFCRWIGQSPTASDHISQPSKKLEKMIKDKFGRNKWTNLEKPKILRDHMDVSGENLSESMRNAMKTFQQLPCAKQP